MFCVYLVKSALKRIQRLSRNNITWWMIPQVNNMVSKKCLFVMGTKAFCQFVRMASVLLNCCKIRLLSNLQFVSP